MNSTDIPVITNAINWDFKVVGIILIITLSLIYFFFLIWLIKSFSFYRRIKKFLEIISKSFYYFLSGFFYFLLPCATLAVIGVVLYRKVSENPAALTAVLKVVGIATVVYVVTALMGKVIEICRKRLESHRRKLLRLEKLKKGE